MRNRQAVNVGLVSLTLSLVAPLVWAEELRATVEASTAYNSNVYGRANNEQSDLIYRVGPEFELRDNRDSKLDYLLSYAGNYESYKEESEASTTEHRQRLRMSYEFDTRNQLTLNQRYRDISNLQFDRDDFIDGDTAIDVRQSSYERNDINFDYQHILNRKWTLNAGLRHQIVDFKRNVDRSDSDSFGLDLALRYQLSQRHEVGFELSYTEQDFDRAASRLSAQSDYVRLGFLWSYRINEYSELEFEGGPVWIDSEQDLRASVSATQLVGQVDGDDVLLADFNSCRSGRGISVPIASRCQLETSATAGADLGGAAVFGFNGAGVDLRDDEVAFFGRAAIRSQVAAWSYEASYERQQNATAGDALAAVLDQLAVSVDYAPGNARWSAYAELRWDKREALTNGYEVDYTVVPGANNVAMRDQAFLVETGSNTDRKILTSLFGFSYDITRQLSTDFEARFRKNKRDSDFLGGQESDAYILQVSVRYEFEPERF